MPNASSVRPLSAVSTLVLAALAACGDKNPNKPVDLNAPAAVTVTAGGGQTGLPGAALAQPIVAKVVNAQGSPLSGASVTFKVARGNGYVANATSTTVVTDAQGTASVSWFLGSGTVRQALDVSAGTAVQRVAAVVDTTRLLYLSAPDTVNAGDTLHLWTAVGLSQAPGEVWGTLVSTLYWPDKSYVTFVHLTPVDPAMVYFYHNAPTLDGVTLAASLPTNSAAAATSGPRMYSVDLVINSAAKGKDVLFTLGARDLVAARTFTDLKPRADAVGTSVHVR